MEDGISLYQGLIAAVESDDMKQVAAFMRILGKKSTLEHVSFYALDALAHELRRYISRLESSDSRGLKGKSKGNAKNDMLSNCKRVLKEIVELKKVKKERIETSRKDHTSEYRDFLPREFTRNMDPAPLNKGKQKVNSR
jgi:hypothetical protein